MKIALIRQKYNPAGGAERFVSRAIGALSREGVGITLITRRWPKEAGGEAITVDPFYIGSTWRDWSFARGVQRVLSRERFDLVQSHERIPGVEVYRAGDGVHREWLRQRARVLPGWRRVLNGLNPYHRYTCAAEAKMFRDPALKAVICISNLVKADVQRHFGLPDEKLPVLYLGVDTAQFHPSVRQTHRAEIRARLGVAEQTRVWLFVGSGFERKGLATAIRALSRVPAAELWVVGRDKHQARYEALAKEVGVAEQVRFLGTTQDVRPYYGSADVFVMPALYEPFGNVFMEAMACGLPIVTSHTSGAADLVQPGKTGWVVDALDVAGLIGVLVDLQPEQAAEMGRHARTVAEGYDLSIMAGQLTALYARLTTAKMSSTAVE